MPALKPETRGQLLKVGVAVLTNGLLKRGLRNQFRDDRTTSSAVRWKHARRAASWSSILSVARGRLRPAI
jgi:hypothetical protein